MATTLASLPSYERFDPTSDPTSLAQRWERWIRGLENMLNGMNISDVKQRRCLLLHYAGAETCDIFETLTDTGAEDDYDSAKAALLLYFTPKKNVDYEIHVFRHAIQEADENIDAFHTRLRRLSVTCDFSSVDKEIKSQILFGCTSKKLRRKCLQQSMPLKDMLEFVRALEASGKQAQEIENFTNGKVNRVVHKFESKRDTHQKQKQSDSDHKKNTCFKCGGTYPHKKDCPAKGKECHKCGKSGHFGRVCRSDSERPKQTQTQTQKPWHNKNAKRKQVVKQVVSEDTSDSDGSIFVLKENSVDVLKVNVSEPPSVVVNVCGADVQMIIDTGCPRDIIDEVTYLRIRDHVPALHPTGTKLFAYKSNKPLNMVGYFDTEVKAQDKTVKASIFVVSGSASNLLSSKSAQALGLVQFNIVMNAQENISIDKAKIDKVVNEFSDRFKGIGELKDCKIKFHVDETVKPIAQPHRRIPFSMREKLESKLIELEEADIIEKVEGPTPWVSPIVCVPKPHNPEEIRVCVDMRAVNTAIERERHITPTVNEIISDLNGSKIFSKLDLNQGYHQLLIAEESRNLTTFTTHMGLRRYKRLNFGISCASEIFQNAISQALEGIPGVLNISDDILLFGANEDQHLETLKAVLTRLRELNLTLNRKKCEFGKTELNFFGHVFHANGISPDFKKVKAIIEATKPTNAGEIRSFLGMVNYMSRFIDNLATITKPLRDLTKANAKWEWGEEQEQSYNQLKEKLTCAGTMAYFDTSKDAELHVDASPFGLGAILLQGGKPIAYGSRTLSPVEQRYSQTEREALAVYWGCEHYRLYTYGRPVVITTDHKPLESIFGNPKSKPPPRIERWMLKLQDYNKLVKYAPGRDNPADYMSRHPISETAPRDERATEAHVNFVADHSTPRALSLDQIRTDTKLDDQLAEVISVVESGRWADYLQSEDSEAKSFWNIRAELSVTSDGILLRDHRIVLPKSMRMQGIKLAHTGHQGLVKTKALLREKVWFPGIDKLVETEIRGCIPCLATTNEKSRPPLKMTVLPLEPWEKLSMDFCGPFPSGEYLLVVVDDHSRFPEVDIIGTTSGKATIRKLDKLFSSYGVPKEVKTDNGPPFNGFEFKSYAETMGFKHRKITPLWPEANGEAERFMRTLKKAIHAAVADGKNWKDELWKFLRVYRATPHQSTGIAPAKALFGRNINVGFPSVDIQPSVDKSQDSIRVKDAESKAKMKRYADMKRSVKVPVMQPGDSVLVKNEKKGKLIPMYNPEPQVVVYRKGDMVTASDGHKKMTRNASQFKKVCAPAKLTAEEFQDSGPSWSGTELLDTVDPSSDSEMLEDEPVETNAGYVKPKRLTRHPAHFKDYVTSYTGK